MDFSDVAARLWPLWILGLFVAFTAWKTDNKSLLRVEPKTLKKFVYFLMMLTVYRLILFRVFSEFEMIKNAAAVAKTLPLGATLTVFWEDLTFAVPLVFLSMLFKPSKVTKIAYYAALAFMMVTFGSGHIYQGWIASVMLSFYVPFSISRGKMYGFGTVILCHMMYDLATLLTLKFAFGM